MQAPVQGVVFSRDRAMQLDGMLRSFLLHAEDLHEVELIVIYKATTSLHAQQYAWLANEYNARIRFVAEGDFRKDFLRTLISPAADGLAELVYRCVVSLGPRLAFLVRRLLEYHSNRYVLFLVDDNIFVRNFCLREVCSSLTKYPTALGFSLRLGANITYCYTADMPQTLPQPLQHDGHILRFNWPQAQGDWNYPLEISSSVYRLSDILPVLTRLSFQNPNTLEASLAASAPGFKTERPVLLCFEQPVTFCNPVNKVQAIVDNRSGTTPHYSSESLAQLFAMGYRINIDAYIGFMPVSCHQEVAFAFETLEAHK